MIFLLSAVIGIWSGTLSAFLWYVILGGNYEQQYQHD